MIDRLRVWPVRFVIVAVALWFAPVVWAQEDSGESKGINSGDYNIHSSVEFGYRASEINGNQNTYDTFENLGSGSACSTTPSRCARSTTKESCSTP